MALEDSHKGVAILRRKSGPAVQKPTRVTISTSNIKPESSLYPNTFFCISVQLSFTVISSTKGWRITAFSIADSTLAADSCEMGVPTHWW